MKLQKSFLELSVSILLVCFICLPFFILFSQFQLSLQIDWAEFFWVFKNSLYQSTVSATCAVILGSLLSFGIPHSQFRGYRFIQFSALVPFFTPPLFLILSLMSLISPFPLGLSSVILVHVIIYTGFVAFQLSVSSDLRLSSYADSCRVMGTPFRRYFISVFFPILKKEIGLLWMFVFFGCFTSFAVTMMIGGLATSSLEVLVYEIIRYQSQWGSAISISIIQTIFIFILGWFFQQKFILTSRQNNHLSQPYRQPLLFVVFPLLLFFIIFGLIKDFSFAKTTLLFQKSDFYEMILQSLSLGLGTSLFVYLFLLLLAFSWRDGFLEKFFMRYSGPTPALTAFSMLILFSTADVGFLIQAIFAITLVSLPFFMKTDFVSAVQTLENQKDIARTLGSSEIKTFLFITWPQVHGSFLRISGFVGIWALGDFSISRILATKNQTLALHIESLISHYRLDEAVSSALVLVFLILVYFSLWKGVGNVLGQKLNQKLWRVFH